MSFIKKLKIKKWKFTTNIIINSSTSSTFVIPMPDYQFKEFMSKICGDMYINMYKNLYGQLYNNI